MTNFINPDDLVQRILRLISREVEKLESSKMLNERQINLLPRLLSIILATHKDHRSEQQLALSSINVMTVEELEALYEKEQSKQGKK